jgi:iron complex transport system ATP-binding protein
MRASLRVQSVSFEYESEKPVLRNVSLEIAGGSVTGIVGPNGAGKSTLLRLMAGHLGPGQGSVAIDGRPVIAWTPRERARVLGFLPQTVNPIFSMSVYDAVCLGRYPHTGAFGALTRRDREVVERCLRDTQMESLANREFLSLSGGERQRVLLASLLAQEPSILLLDEPTASLDIHHQIEILELLAQIAREGYGVAIVTHDLNLAARFCHSLLLLPLRASNGASTGKPEDVLTEPILSKAYGAPIRVCLHPITGTPLVTVESQENSTP